MLYFKYVVEFVFIAMGAAAGQMLTLVLFDLVDFLAL